MAVLDQEPKVDFGERVRMARERQRMSRAELAQKADISRPYLYALEDGSSMPSIEYAVKIARALDVSIIDLLGEERPRARALEPHKEPGVQESEQADGDLGLFWALLTARASAVQKVYRFENVFPLDDVYQKLLDYFDRVLREHAINDVCAQHAIDAVKVEHEAGLGKSRPAPGQLDQAVQGWMEALKEAEKKNKIDALLALEWNLGNALNARYTYKEALEHLEKARTLLAGKIVPEDEAGFHTGLGWTSYYCAEFDKAATYFLQAIQKWKAMSTEQLQVAKDSGLAGAYRGLGSAYQRHDRFREAEDAFVEMLKYAEQLASERGGNRLQLLWGKFRIGSFYIHKGDWSEAQRYLNEANDLWNGLAELEQSDRAFLILRTMILNNRANLLIRRGLDCKTAQEYLEQSIAIGKDVSDRRALAYSQWFLANLYMNIDKWDEALLYLDLSQPHFHMMSLQRYEWSAEVSKARVYCAFKAREAARSLIDNTDASVMQSPSQKAELLATKAFVYAQTEDFEKAREAFEESIPRLETAKYEAAGARLDYAEMLVQLKEFKQAREQLDLARQIASDLGAQALLKRAGQILQQIPS